MNSRYWAVLPALLAGILIGAILMQLAAPPVTGTSVPSHTLSTATGCADADDPRGWVGVVTNAESRAVYLQNYSYAHEAPDVEIRGELTESAPNAWTFAITVTPGDEDRDVAEDCRPRSTIGASIALPPSAESLRITLDGTIVADLDLSANAPQFRYLQG